MDSGVAPGYHRDTGGSRTFLPCIQSCAEPYPNALVFVEDLKWALPRTDYRVLEYNDADSVQYQTSLDANGTVTVRLTDAQGDSESVKVRTEIPKDGDGSPRINGNGDFYRTKYSFRTPFGVQVEIGGVPEDVVSTTAPFFASLPMTTIDGAAWNYDLTLFPKNATGGPDLEKTLRVSQPDTGKNDGSNDIHDGYAHTGTASDGDVIDYQIISRLPIITSRASYLTTYTVVDTLRKGVTYDKNDVKLEWFKGADCTQRITEWTETDEDLKFSVSYADGADDAEVMTIAMTEAGLAEVNAASTIYGSDSIYSGYSECYVRITYAATVNSDATVVYGDDGNPNEVTLEWRRTNTAYYDTLKDCCHLYTYGIQLNKRFSDNAGDYSEVTFTIRNTTDSYWLKAELAEGGLYYVTGHVDTEAEATSFVPNSDSGVLTVWGLEDDAYAVTETHTAKGYTLLKEAISVVITALESETVCEVCGAALLTATATVNGKPVAMLENNGSVNAQVPLTVVNTKGLDLPVTGDDGVWRYGVFGILLMAAAACMIVLAIRKKKPSKR